MQPEGANDALHMVDARLTPLVSFYGSNDPWTRPPCCHPRAIADPGDAVAAARRATQRPVTVRVTYDLPPASRENRQAANCLQLAALSNRRGGTRTRDPGIMRAGAALGSGAAHCANCSTGLPRFPLNATGFGSSGGSCAWPDCAILEGASQVGRASGALPCPSSICPLSKVDVRQLGVLHGTGPAIRLLQPLHATLDIEPPRGEPRPEHQALERNQDLRGPSRRRARSSCFADARSSRCARHRDHRRGCQ